MKEIKFRAWDKENKKMFGVSGYFMDMGIEKRKYMLERHGGKEDGDITINKSFDEVDLMQFTGLKDKNGKEIYEGDILRTNGIDGKCLWVIEWEESSYVYGFSPNHIGGKYSSVHNHAWEEGEVIGNIYETPELLIV